jgi:hypothetical protein
MDKEWTELELERLPKKNGFRMRGEEMTAHIWLNESGESDFVHINGSILGGSVNGPAELFIMRSKFVAPGESILHIAAKSELRDSINRTISFTAKDGIIRINPEIATEECAWGVIKELLR